MYYNLCWLCCGFVVVVVVVVVVGGGGVVMVVMVVVVAVGNYLNKGLQQTISSSLTFLYNS